MQPPVCQGGERWEGQAPETSLPLVGKGRASRGFPTQTSQSSLHRHRVSYTDCAEKLGWRPSCSEAAWRQWGQRKILLVFTVEMGLSLAASGVPTWSKLVPMWWAQTTWMPCFQSQVPSSAQVHLLCCFCCGFKNARALMLHDSTDSPRVAHLEPFCY